MRFRFLLTVLLALLFVNATPLMGQELEMPKPGPEYDVFKSDVGTWDVEIKTWGAPGEPSVTKGTETARLLGGFWLVVDFQGNMMGLDFQGHGIYSYDAKEKHYVGTWVDSLTPQKMEMVGKHDKANNTMTYEGMAPGADGQPTKHVLTTKYNSDGTRVMTMHMQAGDEMMQIFEMSYTRAKSGRTLSSATE